MSTSKPYRKAGFALPEAKEVAETGIKQCVCTVQAHWQVKLAQRSTCCTQQGWNLLGPPAVLSTREQQDLLLAARQL